jgi:predicted O-methyltransferase YrrM
MNPTLAKILQTSEVSDRHGKKYPLRSATGKNQCLFLQKLIREAEAQTVIEIGLAYGISSLAIGEVLQEQENPEHHILDPWQRDWHDIGLLNLERAGFHAAVKFYREPSCQVLPRLSAQGLRADFAYLDSSKNFEVLMVDAFFLQKILKPAGLLVLDDCYFPGIRKLTRLLCRNPVWKVHSTFEPADSSLAKRIFSRICRLVPYGKKIFLPSLLELDSQLGIHAHCVAFQKCNEDERPWSWFRDF